MLALWVLGANVRAVGASARGSSLVRPSTPHRLLFAAVPVRTLVLLSGLVVAMVAAPIACGSPYEAFPPDQVCRDVGYAISARAFECTGDTQLAEARYDRFSKQYRCLVNSVDGSPIDVYYHCPAQITAPSCDQVVAYGDDLSKYVQFSPTCRQFLAGDGLVAPGEGTAGAAGAAFFRILHFTFKAYLHNPVLM